MIKKYKKSSPVFHQNEEVLLAFKNSSSNYLGDITWASHSCLHSKDIFNALLDKSQLSNTLCKKTQDLLKNNAMVDLLPWHSMRNNYVDEKFFLTEFPNFWITNAIGLPASFDFRHKIIQQLNGIFGFDGVRENILKFFNLETVLKLGELSIDWLAQIRSNKQVSILSQRYEDSSYSWDRLGIFCNLGIASHKKFVKLRSGPNILLEYELWWFCSFRILLNIFWRTWEEYLAAEEKHKQFLENNIMDCLEDEWDGYDSWS